MGYTYNPFTGKLDNKWSASSSITPQSWLASPEGAVAARYAGDTFIDTAHLVYYTNPVSGATTGWEIVQTAPAL